MNVKAGTFPSNPRKYFSTSCAMKIMSATGPRPIELWLKCYIKYMTGSCSYEECINTTRNHLGSLYTKPLSSTRSCTQMKRYAWEICLPSVENIFSRQAYFAHSWQEEVLKTILLHVHFEEQLCKKQTLIQQICCQKCFMSWLLFNSPTFFVSIFFKFLFLKF